MSYEEFINNILETRGRFNCGEEYHERHHIVPKCLGGTNDEDNLIDLFAREHFIAHRLLALENPENTSLQFALWALAGMANKKHSSLELCTPEEFEEARKRRNLAICGENNPMYGSHRLGENNPMYGKHHTEETKRKIAQKSKENSLKGNWKNNGYIGVSLRGEDSPSFGIKRTEEQRKHLSESKKKHIEIACYKLDGTLYKVYQSEWAASKDLNISVPLIRYSLKKSGNTAKGFIFILTENKKPKSKIKLKKREYKTKSVVQLTVSNEFVKIWKSINDIKKELGIDCSSIIRCCKGKNKTAGGYKWKYKEEGDAYAVVD